MCQPGWSGVWGRMDTCICMAESLHCSPGTITTLLISYTPIQNVFGVRKFFFINFKGGNQSLKVNNSKRTWPRMGEERLWRVFTEMTLDLKPVRWKDMNGDLGSRENGWSTENKLRLGIRGWRCQKIGRTPVTQDLVKHAQDFGPHHKGSRDMF